MAQFNIARVLKIIYKNSTKFNLMEIKPIVFLWKANKFSETQEFGWHWCWIPCCLKFRLLLFYLCRSSTSWRSETSTYIMALQLLHYIHNIPPSISEIRGHVESFHVVSWGRRSVSGFIDCQPVDCGVRGCGRLVATSSDVLLAQELEPVFTRTIPPHPEDKVRPWSRAWRG